MVSPHPETGFAPDIGGDLGSFGFRALALQARIRLVTGSGHTAWTETATYDYGPRLKSRSGAIAMPGGDA